MTTKVTTDVLGNASATPAIVSSAIMTQLKGADIASAGTVNLDTATGDLVDVTGTTTITVITLSEGRCATVRFTGILTLTNGASLVLPSGANILTAAGDFAMFRGYASGVVRCVLFVKAANGQGMTLATEQATTSGTSIDFTGIPSWVKRITLMLAGVSTSGTSGLIVQLGDSGGIENTNYLGSDLTFSAGAIISNTAFTSGFLVHNAMAAAGVVNGSIIITLEDSSDFTWCEQSAMGRSDGASLGLSGGRKALSAQLDRIRLTTAGGTDTFDAGAVNIMFE